MFSSSRNSKEHTNVRNGVLKWHEEQHVARAKVTALRYRHSKQAAACEYTQPTNARYSISVASDMSDLTFWRAPVIHMYIIVMMWSVKLGLG